MFTGTWNIGSELPVGSLDDWIPKNHHDVYAIGVQECNYKPGHGRSTDEHWFGLLEAHLGDGYVVLSAASLWAIRLIVFVRRELRSMVSDVKAASEATGVGHVAGNKGGLGVSLCIGETSFLFVNAHLAAHEEFVDRRNSDVGEIVSGLNVLSRIKDTDAIMTHDVCLWMGDLNYRLVLPFDEAISGIEQRDWPALQAADQLAQEMAKQSVFVDFTALPTNFAPTFKLTKGRDGLSTDAYNPKRVPSWTDRILFRAAPHARVRPGRCEAIHETLCSSDHAPVRCAFDITVRHSFVPRTLALPAPGSCQLVLRQLSGSSMLARDQNGLSDPYVVFSAPCLANSGAKTGVAKCTLDPVWTERDVPVLVLVLSEVAYLRHQSVFVQVVDKDLVSRNDAMGQAWLSLAAAVAQPGEAVPFTLRLICEGALAGTLQGTLTLQLEEGP